METILKKSPNNFADDEFAKSKFILSQFIYNCSHSFRSPLKTMQGLLFLLEESLNDTTVDKREYLALVLQSIVKVERMVQESEAFLADSSLPLKVQPIFIRDIMPKVLDGFKTQVDERHIEVFLRVNQTCPFHLDVNRFTTILARLFSNAIMFHDDRKSKKQIEIFVDADTNGCLMRVRDNGTGMTEEIQSKIFQPFYRGSEKSGGPGVGLYIADKLISTMGGHIFVRSKFAEGSDFNVWIPNKAV